MSPDPYTNNLLNTSMPCTAKDPVPGKVVAVLGARAEKRGLVLSPFPSRAVQKHEVHELILTAEDAAPNATVDLIAYLCFFEVLSSGIFWQGDRVLLNGKEIGVLAGYEFSHLPNHMNIIVKSEGSILTGAEMKLKPGDPVEFCFKPVSSH